MGMGMGMVTRRDEAAFGKDQRCQFRKLKESRFRLETLEWWTPRDDRDSYHGRVGERVGGVGPKVVCALVLTHTLLADVLKAEIEDEVRVCLFWNLLTCLRPTGPVRVTYQSMFRVDGT
jgi:hypothetical protein